MKHGITVKQEVNTFPFLLLSDDETNHGLLPNVEGDITTRVEETIADVMSSEYAVLCLDQEHLITNQKIEIRVKLKYSGQEESIKKTFWLEPIGELSPIN